MDTHTHNVAKVTTYDGDSLEEVCLGCGQVFEIDLSPIDKLDKCYDLESFLNVRYGPATFQGLQKFLLSMPTDPRLKCRDKLYLDAGLRAHLKAYTHLMRLCENYYIPEFFANEAMRMLLRAGKGLHSQNMQARMLIQVISKEPRLQNRILPLSGEIVPRKKAKPKVLLVVP